MSENPTSQPTPPVPITTTNSHYFSTAPKSKSNVKPWYFASPAFVVVAIMGKYAIRGMAEKPQDHHVGASETSREGRDVARHEIYLMIKDGDPDKSSSYDLTVVPTTNLSKAFKEYLASRVQGEKNLNRGFRSIDFGAIIGEQNATLEGRKTAAEDANRADKAVLDYCDFSRKNVVKFEQAWQTAMHEPKPSTDQLGDLASKLRNQYGVSTKKRTNLLNFYTAHPPKSDGITLVFTGAQQRTYEHLMVDYQKSIIVFEKTLNILDTKTEEHLREQSKMLRDRGPEK